MSMMLVRRDADDIREIRPRAALGALIVVCTMLVLVVRLYQLQILRGDEYTAQSVSNFRKSLFVPADRGMIKDRLGRTLVDNRPSFDVFLTPAFCKGKEKEEVMAKLATYLLMTPDDVERMKQDYQRSWSSRDKLEKFKPYLVELDIPRDQVDVLLAHHTELSCVDLIPTPHRNYRVGPARWWRWRRRPGSSSPWSRGRRSIPTRCPDASLAASCRRSTTTRSSRCSTG